MCKEIPLLLNRHSFLWGNTATSSIHRPLLQTPLPPPLTSHIHLCLLYYRSLLPPPLSITAAFSIHLSLPPPPLITAVTSEHQHLLRSLPPLPTITAASSDHHSLLRSPPTAASSQHSSPPQITITTSKHLLHSTLTVTAAHHLLCL